MGRTLEHTVELRSEEKPGKQVPKKNQKLQGPVPRNQPAKEASDERCTFGVGQTDQSSSRPTGGSSYRLVRGTNTVPSDSEQRGTGDLRQAQMRINAKDLHQVQQKFGLTVTGTETGRFGSMQQ